VRIVVNGTPVSVTINPDVRRPDLNRADNVRHVALAAPR
jgi:hypothetical protein